MTLCFAFFLHGTGCTQTAGGPGGGPTPTDGAGAGAGFDSV